MALWPSFRRDMVGFQPTNLYKVGWLNQHAAATNIRLTAFGVFTETASWPGGAFPAAPMKFAPIVAGGMSARSYPSSSMSANMLQGAPMQASFTSGITGGTPSMSLIVSMSATWSSGSTWDANMRLTVGMQATFTSSITGTANLAMIVPFGTATFTSGISGTADLKGNLSMSASFGGAEPLSPQGLARAVWDALATEFNTPGTMGELLNASGAAGNPWITEIEPGFTASRFVRIIAAAVAGKVSGAPTSPVFRDVSDSENMITGTADSNGNRTSATYGG